jgi:phosphoribosylaminoimidazole-succinocarboxamide synthase
LNISNIKKQELLYEGKVKKLFRTNIHGYLIQEFKDDATAGDGEKHEIFKGKGVLNNKISSIFFKVLNDSNIDTHFIEVFSENSMIVKDLEMVPIEVVVRNISAGSIARRLGLQEGKNLIEPVVEYYLKNDSLNDPMLNRYHIKMYKYLNFIELDIISNNALQVNKILGKFLKEKGLKLVDLKLEYGKTDGDFCLGDEVSPDTCRFWDSETGEILDKDRFRRDMGDLLGAYREILKRISE